MKAKKLFLLSTLLAVLNLLSAGRVTAQTFTTLHSFAAGYLYIDSDEEPLGYANSDGIYPNSLVLSGNTLYGAAGAGGWGTSGTLFAVNTDGTGFTNLYNFALPDLHGHYVPPTNPDGADPNGLILSGNILCGEAGALGWLARGTLFAMNTDGTGFTNLLPNGSSDSGLVLSGNTLYWGLWWGATIWSGTVVGTNMNGTGFANSADGASGQGLIASGNTLYGTAAGYLFAVNTNGTGLTNLHSFTATSGPYPATNSDGASPQVGLILSGNTLYGTARFGGNSGNGTVFAVNTNGTAFRVLHSFTTITDPSPGTNSDGANPSAGLILSGHTLYGTAYYGGISGAGTVFAVNTDGTGFTNLHNFTGSDGANPSAGLILSGNTLYGAASHGGSSGSGTVFSLSFAPQLTITPSGIPPSAIILSWPTNVAGFDYTGYTLQSTTNLDSAFWSSNSPVPVVIAGQNTVTTSITAAQQFYRLIR